MAVSRKGNCFVIPRDKESSEARASRFKKIFNRSRVAPMTKDNRYNRGKKTKIKLRNAALMREKYREERERQRFYA